MNADITTGGVPKDTSGITGAAGTYRPRRGPGFRNGVLVVDLGRDRIGVLVVGRDYSLEIVSNGERWVPDPDQLRLANDEERRKCRLGPRVTS